MKWKILLDFNKFYVSVCRAFEPSTEFTPMLVRSNNDGPGICVSRECKKYGIGMFSDITLMEQAIRKYNIIDWSVNFTLIGDMSKRAKSVIGRYFSIKDVSVDEVIAESDAPLEVVKLQCAEIQHYMLRGLHLPISCGIAETVTLTKVAIEFAKSNPGYKGICAIGNDEQREKALKLTPIGEVWHIGEEREKKLKRLCPGLETAYDFLTYEGITPAWVRKNFTVVVERLRQELLGISCINVKDMNDDKESLMVSRSFGHNVADKDQVKMAMITFIYMIAEKLRKQKSKTKEIKFFLATNPYRTDLGEDYPWIEIQLPVATSSSLEMSEFGMVAIDAMFKEGIHYKKCGVGVDELCDEDGVQGNLMDFRDRAKEDRLMKTFDYINGKYGRFTVQPAILTSDKSDWKIRQKNLPPYWTTRKSDFIKAVDYPAPGSAGPVLAERRGTFFIESIGRTA